MVCLILRSKVFQSLVKSSGGTQFFEKNIHTQFTFTHFERLDNFTIR